MIIVNKKSLELLLSKYYKYKFIQTSIIIIIIEKKIKINIF